MVKRHVIQLLVVRVADTLHEKTSLSHERHDQRIYFIFSKSSIWTYSNICIVEVFDVVIYSDSNAFSDIACVVHHVSPKTFHVIICDIARTILM